MPTDDWDFNFLPNLANQAKTFTPAKTVKALDEKELVKSASSLEEPGRRVLVNQWRVKAANYIAEADKVPNPDETLDLEERILYKDKRARYFGFATTYSRVASELERTYTEK